MAVPGTRTLPAELYVGIFGHLDYQSLLRCSQVCTIFRDFISKTTSLQYKIELAVSGQLDNPYCSLPTLEKLEQLKKHQEAWRELKWSREYDIPIGDGHFWELYGGVLANSTARGTFIFNQLASILRHIGEKSWEIAPDPKIPNVRDFTMDPSQDLFVLVENPDWTVQQDHYNIHFHFRTMSTGQIHRQACEARRVTHRLHGQAPHSSFDMQVFGHLILVFMVGEAEPEVFIWDWKTGDLLCNIVDCDLCAGTLLSEEWLVLGIDDAYGCPALATVNFRRDGPQRHKLDETRDMTIFGYPSLGISTHFAGMSIRCDPGPLWTARPHKSSAFYTDPKEFILVVSLGFEWEANSHTCTHVIPSAHLLSLAETSANQLWDDWAPKHTQLLTPRHLHSGVWVCFVSGRKYVFITSRSSRYYTAMVVDGNQLPLRRGTTEVRSVIDAKAMKAEKLLAKLFDEPATTSMAIISNVFAPQGIHSHCDVMCSEDNIIIVDPVCGHYRVLVF